jgi:hypothetical protein
LCCYVDKLNDVGCCVDMVTTTMAVVLL